MTTAKLEERLRALEQEVARLRALVTGAKDPRSTYGMFTGDEVMKRIDQEALKYRERDRAKARRGARRRPKAKT